MKFRLLLPLFGLLLFSSCAEDETPEPEPEPEPTNFCYLQEQITETADGTSTITYTYDEQNRVISTAHLENGELIATRTYEYGANGRLTRENLFGPENEEIHYTQYSYNTRGLLTKYEVLQPLSIGTIHHVAAFKATYNTNGSLASAISYTYQNNQLKQEQSSRFSYARDTITTVAVTFSDSEQNYNASYTLDDNRAPLSAVPAFHIRQPGVGYPGRNNLHRFTATRGDVEADDLTYTADYTYNERGYPTKAVLTYADESITTITYKYDCI